MSSNPTPQSPSLVELMLAYMPARVLHVAARLGIADLLADGSRTSGDLAEATKAEVDALHRLLRALATLGVVTEIEPSRFELTSVGAQLRSDAPDSIRGLGLLCSTDEVWRSWGSLMHTVRTGETGWHLITGMRPFDWMRSHPEEAAFFNAAMADQTRRIVPGLLAAYDFAKFRTLVDVGGGDGTLLAAIVAAVPQLRGVVYDVPAGVGATAETFATAGVADRCEVILGDFFQAVAPGGDVYLLKSVLHDWEDERAKTILSNCRDAMTADATLLIVELVLPAAATPAARAAVMSDISMMVNPGGRERTEAEFRGLLAESGFEFTATLQLLGGYCIIESRAGDGLG